MSDEQRRDGDADVEGHARSPHSADEPADESEDNDVEAHVRKFSVRMDDARQI
jgi:hypothetical protein